MRTIITIFFLIYFNIGFSQVDNYATIYGKILNVNGSFQYFKLDELSTISYKNGLNNLILDSLGNFSAIIVLGDKPSYYSIGFNKIYLEKDDSIEMIIDNSDPQKSSFKGRGAEKQNFLKSVPFQRSGSYLAGGLNIKKDYQNTIDTILALSDRQIEQLIDLNNVSDSFIFLEKARIKSDIINSLYNIPTYYLHVFRDSKIDEKSLPIEYDRIVDPLIQELSLSFLDEDYLQLESYRHIISIINKSNKNNRNKVIDDWVLANNISRSITPSIDIKDTIGISSLKNNIITEKYKKAVSAKLKFVFDSKIDKIADNFFYKDLNNNDISLDSHKGKIIYIDFWATYCVPCIQEKPYLEELKKSYKNDVVFLSLSVDIDHLRWRNFFKNKNKEIDIIEGIVSASAIQNYFVSQIPRYILINQNFEIVNLYSDSPSSNNIRNSLDELLISK